MVQVYFYTILYTCIFPFGGWRGRDRSRVVLLVGREGHKFLLELFDLCSMCICKHMHTYSLFFSYCLLFTHGRRAKILEVTSDGPGGGGRGRDRVVGVRGPDRGPRAPQERPKSGPRAAREYPRAAKSGPKAPSERQREQNMCFCYL